jgi:hypothetical protein
MSVEITVKQADLADVLGAMRIWLDQENCMLSSFRHESRGIGFVVIRASFTSAACVARFQQDFRSISATVDGTL